MLFGIVGASGTGKTTLAEAVSDSLGIEFQRTSITESAKKHGFNAVGVLSIRERIELQLALLDDHLEMLEATPRPLIVDRTPIDMVGYLLAEFDMHSHMRATAAEIEAAERYVEICYEATAKHYDFLFCLGQLESYEQAPTRPAENRAYQTHSQLIMEGALTRLFGRVNYAMIATPEFDKRQQFMHDTIVQRLDEIEKERRSSPHIH